MKVLCITDRQDRPETELFIRLSARVGNLTVMSNPAGRHYGLLVESGVTVMPLQVRSRFDRAAKAAIRAEAERGDYDIIHAFNSRALSCLLSACHRHRARLLAYRGVTTGVSYLKPESWTTYLSPRLDGVFCVADAVRRSLVNLRFLWLHFPAERARTIYKGHDPCWYDVPPVSVPGVPVGARVLCCVSRNSLKKGALSVLDAFDRLPDALNFHLLLVGEIGSNAVVRRRTARCRFPERVHIIGYRPDVVGIIRGSDALVSASQSGEGLPRAVMEAMCVGTPVVATDAGGTAELVRDGETGLLIPKGDVDALAAAVVSLVSDAEAAERRSAAARIRIEKFFQVDRTVDETLAWYQELLRGGSQGEPRAAIRAGPADDDRTPAHPFR